MPRVGVDLAKGAKEGKKELEVKDHVKNSFSDDELVDPIESTTDAVASSSVSPGTTYTAEYGDTYWGIAQQFGLSVSDLQEWNPYPDTGIPVGATINLTSSSVISSNEGEWGAGADYTDGPEGGDDKGGTIDFRDNIPVVSGAEFAGTTGYLTFDQMRDLPNETLLAYFKAEFLAIAKGNQVAIDMLNRYLEGSKAMLTHDVGSTLSVMVEEHPGFKSLHTDVRLAVQEQILTLGQDTKDPAEIRNQLTIPAQENLSFVTGGLVKDIFTALTADNGLLTAIIGGTQGNDILLSELNISETSLGLHVFSGELVYRFYDDFGVSSDDTDSPGQAALWILQHERGVGASFTNQIVVQSPIAGILFDFSG